MCQDRKQTETPKTCACAEGACRVEEKKARKAHNLVLPAAEGKPS